MTLDILLGNAIGVVVTLLRIKFQSISQKAIPVLIFLGQVINQAVQSIGDAVPALPIGIAADAAALTVTSVGIWSVVKNVFWEWLFKKLKK